MKKKKNIYIYIHTSESLALHQKLIQHCKSTILQFKKKVFNLKKKNSANSKTDIVPHKVHSMVEDMDKGMENTNIMQSVL